MLFDLDTSRSLYDLVEIDSVNIRFCEVQFKRIEQSFKINCKNLAQDIQYGTICKVKARPTVLK
ncbi:hypothetical protein BpHYR1_033552 [Brachionus plicatilis]|uniref:Uncharacterized protein n=1 Tax=Brachionus plicatilis TaxID=10195 RepID=A0A3M7T3B4_BRAPC|nr:hypothetical protein BpHYR1_033552 [Brachionus plicatilis]